MKKFFGKVSIFLFMFTLCICYGLNTHKAIAKAAGADKEEAEEIELGEDIRDAISEETEEDWYSFTTEKSDSDADSWFQITLLFKDKQGSGYAPAIYLYDENDKELLYVYSNTSNEEEVDYIKLEQETTYNILVTSPYKNDTADYVFSVSELYDEAGEELDTASDLERNMTNRFELQSPDDTDWFYVEAKHTKPSIIVKNAEVFALNVEIYDIDGIMLEEFSVDATESESMKLTLEDANFYVKVYSEYSTEESKGSYTIAVNDTVKVSKVTLNKSKASLQKGKTMILKATVTPSNASDRKVSWKSSNKDIAKVDKYGKVTARKKGTVTITCTANDGSGKKATCKITVK